MFDAADAVPFTILEAAFAGALSMALIRLAEDFPFSSDMINILEEERERSNETCYNRSIDDMVADSGSLFYQS